MVHANTNQNQLTPMTSNVYIVHDILLTYKILLRGGDDFFVRRYVFRCWMFDLLRFGNKK